MKLVKSKDVNTGLKPTGNCCPGCNSGVIGPGGLR